MKEKRMQIDTLPIGNREMNYVDFSLKECDRTTPEVEHKMTTGVKMKYTSYLLLFAEPMLRHSQKTEYNSDL
jgi:hypothetical protein